MAINFVLNLLSYFVSIVTNFLLTPFILKSIGDEPFGYLMLFISFANQISLIMSAFNSVIGRFIANDYFCGNIKSANRFYSSTVVLNFCVGVSTFALFLACSGAITQALNVRSELASAMKATILLYAFSFALHLLTATSGAKIFVTKRLYISYTINICSYMTYAVSAVVLLSYFSKEMWTVALSNVLCAVFAFVTYLTVGFLLKTGVRFRLSEFDGKKLRLATKSSALNALNAIPVIVLHSVSLLLCNVFLSPVLAGTFYLSKVVAISVESLCLTIGGSVMPKMVEFFSKGEFDELFNLTKFTMKISAAIAGVMIVSFVALGVRFYGFWIGFKSPDARFEIYLLTLINILPMLLLSVCAALLNLNVTTNKLKRPTLANACMTLCIVGSQFLVLKFFGGGVFEVALCACIFYTLRIVLFDVMNAGANLGRSLFAFYPCVFRCLLVLGVLVAAFWGIEKLFADGVVSFFVLGALYCILGAVVSFFCLFDAREKAVLRGKFENLKRRLKVS